MTTRSLILNSTTGQRGFRGHRPWTSSHGTILHQRLKGYYVYTGLVRRELIILLSTAWTYHLA